VAHTVREASEDDADDVVRLLDAAMLESDGERVRRRIEAGTVLVAVVERYGDGDGADTDDRVVGACVLGEVGAVDAVDRADEAGEVGEIGEISDIDDHGAACDVAADSLIEIEHIAVHRSRRGRGIGRALVDAADERSEGALVARFREQVRPFYESLGFETVEWGERGEDPPDDGSDGDRLCAVLR
jgi:ribosomal protein S18 acetylase RimI-like enzyme